MPVTPTQMKTAQVLKAQLVDLCRQMTEARQQHGVKITFNMAINDATGETTLDVFQAEITEKFTV